MTTPDQLRAIIAAVERAAKWNDKCGLASESADGKAQHRDQAALLRSAATLLRRIGPADGEPRWRCPFCRECKDQVPKPGAHYCSGKGGEFLIDSWERTR
jgi:glycine/D-amino acid oxidase-like deaminating enzyme